MSQLSQFNEALISIPKRAEKSESEQLQRTFADLGIMPRLGVVDNQVIYGRRGTGKTHALRNLEANKAEKGDLAVFLSLDTLGTPKDFSRRHVAVNHEFAANLLADFLEEFVEAIRDAIVAQNYQVSEELELILKGLEESLRELREGRRITVNQERGGRRASEGGAGVNAHKGGVGGKIHSSYELEDSEMHTERIESPAVQFADLSFSTISRQIKSLTRVLAVNRLWVLIDEWVSLPLALQPYLAHYLKRCLFPVQKVTVKIAAIEQKANFREFIEDEDIGIELGADVTANVNLDQELSYESDVEKSQDFFRTLFYKHLTSAESLSDELRQSLAKETDVIRLGFTDRRAFEELVRAAEGVPRDAINIASLAAGYAGLKKISMESVRRAAHEWFLQDKKTAISEPASYDLLLWIVDEVIRGMKSRGFLVEEGESSDSRLMYLFDQRVLHIAKKGYSAQDRPGTRYDMWTIDYGAYVDLIGTKTEPKQLLGGDAPGLDTNLSIPQLDGRKVRRSILELSKFDSRRRR